MDKSPKTVYVCDFLLAINNRDNKKSRNKNYQIERNKDAVGMFDYYSDVEKGCIGMFDYYAGLYKKKKTNLILEDGEYATKKEIDKRKKQYISWLENSNLWKGVISFPNDYIDENISLNELEKKIVVEVIPKFLKYIGFKDIKKMSYELALHTNTDNYHLHFSFIEKEPNFIQKNGNIKYRRMGKINEDALDFLKRQVVHIIEKEKIYRPLLIKTNEDIDDLKRYFNPKDNNFILRESNEIIFEENILKLGLLLDEYRNTFNQDSKGVKYNSIKNNKLGREIKKLTKDIKSYLFENKNSDLYKCRDEVNTDLEKLNKYFQKLNDDNNIDSIIESNKLINSKEEYIDNYILNSIVNHALYKYRNIEKIVKSRATSDKITIDDLIQEIAYEKTIENREKDDKKRRKHLLNNYFKSDKANKFQYKKEIEKAFKNINHEMEQAAEKFSELFNYEKQ